MDGEFLRLRFHATTFAMLRETPALSKPAVRRLDTWERRHGRKLPGSLREWYSLEGAVDRLGTNDFECDVASVADGLRRLARQIRQGGEPPGLGILSVGYEATYTALLDGSEDPPVVIDAGDPEDLAPLGPFSEFVFHWTWQDRTHEYGEPPAYSLTALDPHFGPMELDFLIEHFEEGPRRVIDVARWYMEEYSYRYHFFDGTGRVGVSCKADPVGQEVEASWVIQAENARDLRALARRVWPCGTLSRTLSSGTRNGRGVLQRLRQALRRK